MLRKLEVKGLNKRFGPVVALNNVSALFAEGEIHAVLGENGAGKSTLMSVMSGFMGADSGEVLLDGKPVPLGRAFDCKRLGIEMIHQHFTLVPGFTVAENLALARLDGLVRVVHAAELARPALEAGRALGWDLDPDAKVNRLPVGVQQRIEILKAIGGEESVLIFDEPTAVLTPDEVLELFRVLRRLKEAGKIVVLIAHKLSEVLAVADRITVLRRGEVVASALREDVGADQLATWMVGEMPPKTDRRSSTIQTPGLVAEGLTVLGDRKDTAIRGVSFEIQRGEILGFGGVDGNGQVELAECLAQVRRVHGGQLRWQGEPFTSDAPQLGYVPQDRQTDGLAMAMTIEENMLISGLVRKELFCGAFLKPKSVRNWAQSLVERFSITTENTLKPMTSLSGGNQQKVVVSRILDGNPELLVVVNPSRGLDIKATQYVHDKILEARDRGAAVALFSTDLDELYALSDRTVFLSRGSLVEDIGAVSLAGGAS